MTLENTLPTAANRGGADIAVRLDERDGLPARLWRSTRFVLPVLAGLVVFTVVLWALFPWYFAPQSPTQTFPASRLLPPGAEHWFGTDYVGRDLYTRVVHGTRVSIGGASLAVFIGFLIGCLIGIPSGYVGGRTDEVCMRVIDVLLAIPSLLLALMVVTVLGPGTGNAAIAVGVSLIGTFARLSRTEVLRCRSEAYIEAAYLAGSSRFYTLVFHVLPNVSGTLIALGVLEFGLALLSLAALSFLGYGAAAPTPEWGNLVAEGRNYIAIAGWLTILPGAVIALLVVSLNYLSRRIAGRH